MTSKEGTEVSHAIVVANLGSQRGKEIATIVAVQGTQTRPRVFAIEQSRCLLFAPDEFHGLIFHQPFVEWIVHTARLVLDQPPCAPRCLSYDVERIHRL